MKHLLLTIGSAAILFASCNNESATEGTTDKKDSSGMMNKSEDKMTATYTMPDSATAMKNWQDYATPGKEQEMLSKSNGMWTTNVSWWEYPGGPENKSTGTMTNKMIMGGRYQQSSFAGNMMGAPFEGLSYTAFDNMKKVYTSTWIDNMGTGLMVMEGPWDEATKSITMKGKGVDPAVGKELPMKEVFTVIDDNTQKMEMYKPAPDGKEFKTMEITYTRKK